MCIRDRCGGRFSVGSSGVCWRVVDLGEIRLEKGRATEASFMATKVFGNCFSILLLLLRLLQLIRRVEAYTLRIMESPPVLRICVIFFTRY